jgi:hypothetical protein
MDPITLAGLALGGALVADALQEPRQDPTPALAAMGMAETDRSRAYWRDETGWFLKHPLTGQMNAFFRHYALRYTGKTHSNPLANREAPFRSRVFEGRPPQDLASFLRAFSSFILARRSEGAGIRAIAPKMGSDLREVTSLVSMNALAEAGSVIWGLDENTYSAMRDTELPSDLVTHRLPRLPFPSVVVAFPPGADTVRPFTIGKRPVDVPVTSVLLTEIEPGVAWLVTPTFDVSHPSKLFPKSIPLGSQILTIDGGIDMAITQAILEGGDAEALGFARLWLRSMGGPVSLKGDFITLKSIPGVTGPSGPDSQDSRAPVAAKVEALSELGSSMVHRVLLNLFLNLENRNIATSDMGAPRRKQKKKRKPGAIPPTAQPYTLVRLSSAIRAEQRRRTSASGQTEVPEGYKSVLRPVVGHWKGYWVLDPKERESYDIRERDDGVFLYKIGKWLPPFERWTIVREDWSPARKKRYRVQRQIAAPGEELPDAEAELERRRQREAVSVSSSDDESYGGLFGDYRTW